ncbi:hypothetical protein Vafri_15405 [Volvox africanus]|uniref:Uncharacterized protein n=1 Tax=Volvox africanus TaxID=51714 RepID=A0A8J4BLE5_9CHLO|nr:hypothetical protein Vafri_15405 [Volvox africanus]
MGRCQPTRLERDTVTTLHPSPMLTRPTHCLSPLPTSCVNVYPSTSNLTSDYYDDCALRNITAYQTGLNDSSIDPSVVASLPDLLATSTTSGDLIAFNHTLHNATNGLIIDSEYCNYTTLSTSESAGGAVSVALVPLLLMLLLAAIVNW